MKNKSKELLLDKYASPSYNNVISEGDWVIVHDGSYMVGIAHNSYEYNKPNDTKYPFSPGLRNDIFQVVAINVECPNEKSSYGALSYQNNCIIKSLVNKDIFFCSRINITKLEKGNIETNDLNEDNISIAILRDIKLNDLI